LASSGERLQKSVQDVVDLEERLAALFDVGRTAWPGLPVSAEEFAGYLGERIPEVPSLARALDELHAADLYLACACAAAIPQALTTFEEAYFGELERAIRRVDGAVPLRKDIAQNLRQRLFVPEPGRAPRIAEYAGRGSLRSWFRVTALRTVLNQVTRGSRDVPAPDDELGELLWPLEDPELAHLKHFYRAELRLALDEAVRALSARDRALLLYEITEQLSIDRIAALYGVHRSTAHRWVTQARAALRSAVRGALRRRLSCDRADLDSIMRLIHSQLEVSLERRLTDQEIEAWPGARPPRLNPAG
jgi:RNA polymerase sigma-70 factor (ECF subfamily)